MDINDPYIRLVAEALIKTAASKTIEMGLNGIHHLLGRAVKDGDEKRVIEILASDEKVSSPALELANKALAGSFLVPFIPNKRITADELLDLFASVVNIGFSISRKLNCDICLPGSIIDNTSVTWFSSSNKDIPLLERKGRYISIPFKPGSEVGIYPDSKPLQTCHAKMEEIRLKRELTTSYVKVFDSPFEKGFMMSGINTQTVQFSTAYSTKKINTLLGIDGGSAKIRGWSEGINLMIDFIPKIPDLDTLTESSTKQLLDITRKMSALAADIGSLE